MKMSRQTCNNVRNVAVTGILSICRTTALYPASLQACLGKRAPERFFAPGGKTEAFCQRVLEWRKPLLTFDSPENVTLLAMGAKTL